MSRNLVDRGATRGTYGRRVTHMNAIHRIYKWVTSLHTDESCLWARVNSSARWGTYGRVTWMRFIAYIRETCLTYMSHVSHTWVMSHIHHASCLTYMRHVSHTCVMVHIHLSHVYMSHVMVESHTWMRFIAYLNESRLYILKSHVSGTVWVASQRWGTCGRVLHINDFDISEMNLIHVRTRPHVPHLWWSSLAYESHMNEIHLRYIKVMSQDCLDSGARF